MRFINNEMSTDPTFNLALEEYIFETLGDCEDCFMLWQNDNAIIIGRHQNTVEEINETFVRDNGIQVVRRMSGGGAVYHDLGNLNFTYICHKQAEKNFDFDFFMRPVIEALHMMGVPAVFNSRNDMEINGQKFSGNAQYSRNGKILHHGTLLFNSKLDTVAKALKVKPQKIASKGIKSVRSRVTNIAGYLSGTETVKDFRDRLIACLFEKDSLTPYELTAADIAAIKKLQTEKYAAWEWNYGQSPRYNRRLERKFDFGLVTVLLTVRKGIIEDAHFYGDFFGDQNSDALGKQLVGCRPDEASYQKLLEKVTIDCYINGMTSKDFMDLMLDR